MVRWSAPIQCSKNSPGKGPSRTNTYWNASPNNADTNLDNWGSDKCKTLPGTMNQVQRTTVNTDGGYAHAGEKMWRKQPGWNCRGKRRMRKQTNKQKEKKTAKWANDIDRRYRIRHIPIVAQHVAYPTKVPLPKMLCGQVQPWRSVRMFPATKMRWNKGGWTRSQNKRKPGINMANRIATQRLYRGWQLKKARRVGIPARPTSKHIWKLKNGLIV